MTINPIGCPPWSADYECNKTRIRGSYTTSRDATASNAFAAGACQPSKQYPCPGSLVIIEFLEGKGVRRRPRLEWTRLEKPFGTQQPAAVQRVTQLGRNFAAPRRRALNRRLGATAATTGSSRLL